MSGRRFGRAAIPRFDCRSILQRGGSLRVASWVLVALAAPVLFATDAPANGLFENRPWQFATPAETQTKAYIEDFIEKKKAGYYDAGAFAAKNYNLGCSSDAVTTGNSGSNTLSPTLASPVGVGDNDVTSTTSGNQNAAVGDTGSGDSNRDQSNSNSDLDATADGNDFINHGSQTSTANNNDIDADNDQKIKDSKLASNTAGNELCNVTIYD